MFSKIVLLALSCLLFCRVDFQDEEKNKWLWRRNLTRTLIQSAL